MIVTLLGSAGTLPSYKRPLTALYTAINSTAVLIDCGEGTQVGFSRLSLGFTKLAVICLTHYHPDHVLGLPGLLSTLNTWIKNDECFEYKDLLIIGPPDHGEVIRCLIKSVRHNNLNIYQYEVRDPCGEVFDFGEFEIECFFVEHSVQCLGYRINEKKGKKFNIEKARSSGIGVKFWSFLQKGMTLKDGELVRSIDDLTVGEEHRISISYVTDTKPVPSITERIRGSDLAILEGMHYNRSKMHDSAHMLFSEAAEIARDAGVKELCLTHFSPSLSTPEEGLKKIYDIFPNVTCGNLGSKWEFS